MEILFMTVGLAYFFFLAMIVFLVTGGVLYLIGTSIGIILKLISLGIVGISIVVIILFLLL